MEPLPPTTLVGKISVFWHRRGEGGKTQTFDCLFIILFLSSSNFDRFSKEPPPWTNSRITLSEVQNWVFCLPLTFVIIKTLTLTKGEINEKHKGNGRTNCCHLSLLEICTSIVIYVSCMHALFAVSLHFILWHEAFAALPTVWDQVLFSLFYVFVMSCLVVVSSELISSWQ